MNSHYGLVPSTTNSLYSDAPHHEGAHVVQMSGHDGSDVTVDNLVTLTPTESGMHEHSGKWINSLEYGFIERSFVHSVARALLLHQHETNTAKFKKRISTGRGRVSFCSDNEKLLCL